MHVLLWQLVAAALGQRSGERALASLEASGGVVLERQPPGADSPFCRTLCSKSDIEQRGLNTCKELDESECKTLGFYRKKPHNEFRLCIWQPQWKCTEDWTTVCLSRNLQCGDHGSAEPLDGCRAFCYKTDTRSIDAFCHELSAAECLTQQLYETDEQGNRMMCEMRAGTCVASREKCPAGNATCPSPAHFSEEHGDLKPSRDMMSVCRSMCYKTNTAVSGLSCSDLSMFHCSSAQFYESDELGVRRACAPRGGKCDVDTEQTCWESAPLCGSEVQVAPPIPMSHRDTTQPATTQSTTSLSIVTSHTTLPATTLPATTLPATTSSDQTSGNRVPPFCFTLCDKTNTRSLNASCAKLPATSCESGQFYETDHEGKRRLCLQAGGRCKPDSSAVCDEWHPLCDISQADVKVHHAAKEDGCFIYCDKINTRSRNQSCTNLTGTECASGLFYETDHDGHRAMCGALGRGCGANTSTACEAWRPICRGLDSSTRPRGQSPRMVRSESGAMEPVQSTPTQSTPTQSTESTFGGANNPVRAAFGGAAQDQQTGDHNAAAGCSILVTLLATSFLSLSFSAV